jgi:uncharacterized protein with HEPN domain
MNERDKSRLEYIQEEIEFLLEITETNDLNSFLDNRQLQNAVSMILITRGEFTISNINGRELPISVFRGLFSRCP